MRFVVVLACACALLACTTDDAARGPVAAQDPGFPAWLEAPSAVTRSADLDAAAQYLCDRDKDAVIDASARSALQLTDGHLEGVLVRAASAEAAEALLAERARGVFVALNASHAGVATATTATGSPCAALVATERFITLEAPLPAALSAPAPVPLELRLTQSTTSPWRATLYLAAPDGSVERKELAVENGLLDDTLEVRRGEGNYTAEVVVDLDQNPKVALIWPFVVGAPRLAPAPEVLFGDDGHDDKALSHRLETLVQRLRNDTLLDTLTISPLLTQTAVERAASLSSMGALSHRLPDAESRGQNAAQALQANFPDDPRATFVRLVELQAKGSTLAEAWGALLSSPAHRYELVDAGLTHQGVAVVRGQDGAGRPIVSLALLMARRPPKRDLIAVERDLLASTNAAREKRGFDALAASRSLSATALRLASRMAELRTVDDGLLGGPVAEIALEADATFQKVRPLVARLNDPLALGVPPLLLELDAKALGMAFVIGDDGAFYTVLLVGE